MNTQSITFRRLQNHFIFTLGIVSLICGTCCAQTTQENVSPSSVAADRAYEEMMSATLYDELEKLAANWDKKLSEQARAKLIRKLIGTIYDEANKNAPSVLQKRISNEHGRHDLGLRAGRTVWTVERLQNTQFPNVSAATSRSELQELYKSMYEEYEKQLRVKIKRRMEGLSETERMEQARNPVPLVCPDEVKLIVEVLAVDSAPHVRRAVIESKWFSAKALDIMLEKESDPEIRRIIKPLRNAAFARPLADFPMPEGW